MTTLVVSTSILMGVASLSVANLITIVIFVRKYQRLNQKICIHMSHYSNCHIGNISEKIGAEINLDAKQLDNLENLDLKQVILTALTQKDELNLGVDKDLQSAKLVVKAIEQLSVSKILVNQGDLIWIMHYCNDNANLPYFASPRRFLDYLESGGLTTLPSLSLLQKQNNRIIADSHYPQWRFTDDVTDTDATRILKLTDAFTKLIE